MGNKEQKEQSVALNKVRPTIEWALRMREKWAYRMAFPHLKKCYQHHPVFIIGISFAWVSLV